MGEPEALMELWLIMMSWVVAVEPQMAVAAVMMMKCTILKNLYSKGQQARGQEQEENKYSFSQIAILSLVYSLTFGCELAVNSIFPQFLETTFSKNLYADKEKF